jgi:hypothetical protein
MMYVRAVMLLQGEPLAEIGMRIKEALREQYACPVGWSMDVEDEMIKGTLGA